MTYLDLGQTDIVGVSWKNEEGERILLSLNTAARKIKKD